MPIPTMAIACRAGDGSPGPAIVEILAPLVNTIEQELLDVAQSSTGRRPPEHLGLGIRFELDSNSTDGSPGYASDLSCRVDLLNIDMNSSSPTPPEHPTPAVHIEASLYREEWNHDQGYLHGGPLHQDRLRSLGLTVDWTAQNWDATLTLNDASYSGYVDWTEDIPGQLELSTTKTGIGLAEVLNQFLQGYALEPEKRVVESILLGLQIFGLAGQTPVAQPPPLGQDHLWQIYSSSLDSFIHGTGAYLDNLFKDAYGNWDFSKPMSTSGSALFEHIAEGLPWAVCIDDSADPHDGCLSFTIGSGLMDTPLVLYISTGGEVELVLDSLSVGIVNLRLGCGFDLMPAPGSGMGFNGHVVLDMASEKAGIFCGSSLQLTYDENQTNPLEMTLSLPTTTWVPDWQSLPGLTWVQTPSTVQLYPTVTTGGMRDLLTEIIPGLIIDSLLQNAVDNLLLRRVEDGSLFGVILEELGLATNTNGAYTCGSVLGFAHDPVGHLSNHLCRNGGINVDTVLTIVSALVQTLHLPYGIVEESIVSSEPGVSPEHRVTEVSILIEINDTVVGAFAIIENPYNSDSISFSLRSPSGGLVTSWGNFSFDLRMNIGTNLSVDSNGSSISLEAYPTDLLTLAGKTPPALLDNSLIALSFVYDNGPQLELSIDLDTTDSTAPSVLVLLPQLSGLDAFIRALMGDALTSFLPPLLTKMTNNLRTVNVGGTNVGQEIEDIATAAGLWIAGEFNADEIKALGQDPAGYLVPKIPALLTTGIQTACDLLIDPLNTMIAYTQGSLSTISLADTNSPWAAISIEIGEKSGQHGIWLTYNPTVVIDSTKLSIDIGAGIIHDGTDWGHQVSIVVRIPTDTEGCNPILDSTNGDLITLRPAILMSWDSSGVTLELGTDYTLSGTIVDVTAPTSFWLHLFPAPVAYGTPDLTQLLSSAAGMALDFVGGVDAIQDWLIKPLYDPVDPSQGQGILSDCTIPGEILVNLGILTYPGGASTVPTNSPYFEFRLLGDIVTDYSTDPLQVLLNGFMGMVDSAISAQPILYEDTDGEFQFSISLVDANSQGNAGVYGVRFDFLEIPIKLGNLELVLSTQPQGELDMWTLDDGTSGMAGGRSTPMFPGVTLYLLELDSNSVSPHLSLEFGGISLSLRKSGGDALLDSKVILNYVELDLALDLDTDFSGTPTVSIEAGGRLALEDFSLNLGGDGQSDGGNAVAAGALTGGDEPIQPGFDIAVSKYASCDLQVYMRGKQEFWFPIQKSFGPVEIDQIGIKYEILDSAHSWASPDPAIYRHRLGILIDAEVEFGVLRAQADDLEVNIPLLRPLDFSEWKYDLKGLAIDITKDDFKITGALRKVEMCSACIQSTCSCNPVPTIAPEKFLEYQGLCLIRIGDLSFSAVGAFARVPDGNGGFTSVFVVLTVDGLNIPIPPAVVLTGFVGGVGINRELTLPELDNLPDSVLLAGLNSNSPSIMDDPMLALRTFSEDCYIKKGQYWFAVGAKGKIAEAIDAQAVIYVKFSNDSFTLGLLGLASVGLPRDKPLSFIELALNARYDSEKNQFLLEAGLTDASWILDTNCRLTGGFALSMWFNTGEFLLSVGGYHPQFQKPSYYPAVNRVGFSWLVSSKLQMKGGTYFTLCSSAVMVGAGFELTYQSGKLSAYLAAGLDVLVVFDPLYYNFHMYLGIYVGYGKLDFNVDVDLLIEGPKMRGIATVSVLCVTAEVKFGPNASPQPVLSARDFIAKHVMRDENGGWTDWTDGKWLSVSALEGVIRPKDTTGEDSLPTGETESDPWILSPRFTIGFTPLFPSSKCKFMGGDIQADPLDDLHMRPMGSSNKTSIFEVSIQKKHDELWTASPPVSLPSSTGDNVELIPYVGHFVENSWGAPNPTPATLKKAPDAKRHYSNFHLKATCEEEDGTDPLDIKDRVEECEKVHPLPLETPSNSVNRMGSGILSNANSNAVSLAKNQFLETASTVIPREKSEVNE